MHTSGSNYKSGTEGPNVNNFVLFLSSEWLWAPTLAAPIILIIAVLIMENFRTKLAIEAPMEVLMNFI